ncbi:hypothetical protein PR048_022020 [Dryococelus australis]|uniref:Protein cueball n=1 Tax=Dryococelus australis TaxID=614101 RepID=A0ABQ9GZX0_9NEOP|nr:hypothetical protein PR048_022020 [Dryococelus australis]
MWWCYVFSSEVAVGSEEGELIFTGAARPQSIKFFYDTTSLAFDSRQQILFIGTEDRHNFKVTIYSVDLAKDKKPVPIVQKRGKEIPGVAYDGVDNVLYWTDTRAIYRMKLDTNATLELFLSFESGEKPWYLYWTNRNHKNPSIERVKLDGTDRKVLVTEGLFMPVGLAVDQETEKLFWCDNQENINYRIECSNLDGTSQKTLVSGTHHHTNGIAVGSRNVYWSDSENRKVWSIPKATDVDPEITEVDYLAGYGLQGIVAWSDGENLDDNLCYKKPPTLEAASKSFVGMTAALSQSITDIKQHDYVELYCLNGGTIMSEDNVPLCHCQLGYSGTRCEVSVCHNFCMNGRCHVDESNKASCICEKEYRGINCERHKCEDFCLHEGKCYLGQLEEPKCRCKDGYMGRRCEELVGLDQLCVEFCTKGHIAVLAAKLCSCSDTSGLTSLPSGSDNETWNEQKAEGRLADLCSRDGPQNWMFIMMVCSSIFLVIIIGILLLKICHLRRRPRIKKRIIVNKNVAPLTSRPPSSGEQCEITIENCCNMNVCETPCFEPQLRSSKSSSKSDERRNLLVNMEEGVCSPPVQQKQY